jgi:hypothetical protein
MHSHNERLKASGTQTLSERIVETGRREPHRVGLKGRGRIAHTRFGISNDAAHLAQRELELA